MIYFTADTHFNHSNIIKYCDRPFNSVNEMNEIMIQNWNNRVKAEDTVYVLGDFIFGDIEDFLIFCWRLTGNIKFLRGSHDRIFIGKELRKLQKIRQSLEYKEVFDRVEIFNDRIVEIKVEGQHIVLCHYALRVWPRSHYNSWHLFGHSHGKLEPVGKSYDVGVDNNGFTPISFNQIKRIMEERTNNFDFVDGR